MQTILGAGGAIGKDLATVLPEFTDRVRLVSRNPSAVAPQNELQPGDLTRLDDVRQAVAGADVAYLVAGLTYDKNVWREQWPQIMRNVIDACQEHSCRLVFFDNVYMYDRDSLAHMDEDTPILPSSAKGEVRAEIANMLMESVAAGDIQALIARSADFYGPGRQANSMLTQGVFDRLNAGKAAQWLMSADYRHSFTYTPDAARGTAMLGNAEDVWGEVWHLPTAPEPPTGRGWVDAIAAEFDVVPRVQVAGNLLLSAMGLFVPIMKEIREMAYQYDRDYVFVSDKFNRRFKFEPASYASGIKSIIDTDYR